MISYTAGNTKSICDFQEHDHVHWCICHTSTLVWVWCPTLDTGGNKWNLYKDTEGTCEVKIPP